MKHIFVVTVAVLAASMTPMAIAAEEYDFEFGFAFDNASSDFFSPAIGSGGVPMPSLGLSVGSGDADTVSLLGTWYFQGLAEIDGPKSRAAFLNRASSISFGYAYGDDTEESSSTGTLFAPRISSGKTTSDAFSIDLRYVVPDSGWYGLAGISRLDSDFSGQSNGDEYARDFDATDYRVGLGKYIGERTAVDLSVTRSETGGRYVTSTSLSLTHIGSLGANWLYGADIELTKSGQRYEDGTYALGLSLYPSRNFKFGVGTTQRSLDYRPNPISYEGFASWFVRDNIELTGRYAHEDVGSFPGSDLDAYSAGVGINVRF